MAERPPIEYIDTPEGLHALCARLRGYDWLALDTEFIREKTYYPQLCLLQIATPDITACIDPLAIGELGELLDVLYDRRILKVLHAARQDLEILYHLRGEPPSPVFDTQIAAPLLGYSGQIGYAVLAERVIGVTVEKKHTRADWSRRPVSEELLRYAADDVHYLALIYRRLSAELHAHGRRGWLDEDFAALSDAGLYSNTPADAWQRIRGTDRLRGSQLAVLQALAAWREQTAKVLDRPRNWLLRDDVLLDLARQQPSGPDALSHIRSLNERTARRHGADLLEAIARGQNNPPPQVKSARRRHPATTPAQEAVLDAMMALVRIRGAEQSLNPAVIASRAQLEELLWGDPDSELSHGWRRMMVGEELQALLRGELDLHVAEGTLVVASRGRPSSPKTPPR
jgi:ribonuclease D